MSRTACYLGVVLLVLAGCGGGGGDDGGGDDVGAITSISNTLESYTRTLFVLHGSGFAAAGGTAQALFQADTGTPFEGSTSSTAAVEVRVISDSIAMGISPPAGVQAFDASVELNLANGATIFGPSVAVQFVAAVFRSGTLEDDVYDGTTGADTYFGGAGNDTIRGAGNNDNLFGESGHDHLDGQDGHDVIDGGPGDDLFVVEPTPGNWDDQVTDMSRTDDMLLFRGAPVTPLLFDLIASVADTGTTGNVLIVWSAGGSLTLWDLGMGSIDSLDKLVDSGVRILVTP